MTTLDFVATGSPAVDSQRSDSLTSELQRPEALGIDTFRKLSILDPAARINTAKVNRFGIVLVQLHDELWRVTRRSGEVLGYIESFAEAGDRRFRAKRMFSSRRPSMPLGEFWSIDDAIDCFRFS